VTCIVSELTCYEIVSPVRYHDAEAGVESVDDVHVKFVGGAGLDRVLDAGELNSWDEGSTSINWFERVEESQ